MIQKISVKVDLDLKVKWPLKRTKLIQNNNGIFKRIWNKFWGYPHKIWERCPKVSDRYLFSSHQYVFFLGDNIKKTAIINPILIFVKLNKHRHIK